MNLTIGDSLFKATITLAGKDSFVAEYNGATESEARKLWEMDMQRKCLSTEGATAVFVEYDRETGEPVR